MDKQSILRSEKKSPSKKLVPIFGVCILVLISVWAIITVAYPLFLGDGLSGYNGTKRTIAERILKLQYLTFTPSPAPSFVQQVHIDDVRPVTQTEISKYCTDPNYITSDPNNYRYYTVVTTERHLLALGSRTALYIGCEPRGVQREEFGLPVSAASESPSVTDSNGLIITH